MVASLPEHCRNVAGTLPEVLPERCVRQVGGSVAAGAGWAAVAGWVLGEGVDDDLNMRVNPFAWLSDDK